MVIGLLAIVFTALINAILVLLPMFAVSLLAMGTVKFLTYLKVRNDSLDAWVHFLLVPLGVFFAAALQLKLWKLALGQEPWRWICAAATYLLGAFVMLMWMMPYTRSPFERAWGANRFALGGLVMLATLGASFHNKAFYNFLDAAPGQVVLLLIGEKQQ